MKLRAMLLGIRLFGFYFLYTALVSAVGGLLSFIHVSNQSPETEWRAAVFRDLSWSLLTAAAAVGLGWLCIWEAMRVARSLSRDTVSVDAPEGDAPNILRLSTWCVLLGGYAIGQMLTLAGMVPYFFDDLSEVLMFFAAFSPISLVGLALILNGKRIEQYFEQVDAHKAVSLTAP